mmetsp:Transcript_27522/g.70749  ORF Transcript_27522/g.70749 Transcript_27522/m.70749 type:complete len:217 (-) Transcript_27522:565-1215(-)
MAVTRARNRTTSGNTRTAELFQMMEQDLLGVEEQEELVQALQEESASQSRMWCRLFAAVALIAGVFFALAATHHAADPWSTRYTAEFRTTRSAAAIGLGLLGNAVACILAGAGLLGMQLPSPGGAAPLPAVLPRRMAVALAASACCGAFWAWALWVEYDTLRRTAALPPSFRWSLAWLPATPAVVCLICRSAAGMAADLQRSVTHLRSNMYNYKKL